MARKYQTLNKCFVLVFLYSLNGYAAQKIPTVHVTKPSHPISHTTTNAATENVNQKDIQVSGSTSIFDLLTGKGGVQLQDLTGDGSETIVSMRGFGGNAAYNSLILMDGMPLDNPDLGTPDISAAMLADIDKVEIIQGSEGVLLGDQAVGGAINIVTRKTQTVKKGEITAGSYAHKIVHLGLGDHYKDLYYLFSFQENKTNNFRDHNKDNQQNGLMQFYFPRATSATLIHYQIHDRNLLLAGALTPQQFATNPRQAQNDVNFTDSVQQFLHVNHRQAISEQWSVDADLFHQQFSGEGFLLANFSQARRVDQVHPQFIWHKDGGQWFTGGSLQNAHYQFTSLFATAQADQNRQDLYSQIIIPWYTYYKITLGTRVAWQQQNNLDFKRAWVTNIGFSGPFRHQGIWFIRRNGNYRFPKVDELIFDSSPLNTQQGVSYETGLEWHSGRFSNGINLFRLDLQNEIAFDPTPTLLAPFGTNENLAPTRRLGIILTNHWQILKQWQLTNQYSFTDATFARGINAGQHIPFVSQHVWQLISELQLTDHWHWYVENNFFSPRYALGDVFNVGPKISRIWLLNMNLRYQYHNFSANFRINNILNSAYPLLATFVPSMQESFLYPAPFRNFLLTLQYQI